MWSTRYLDESDATAYVKLRREALDDSPMAFGASPASDVASTLEAARTQLRGGDGVIVGAFEGGELIAMVGLLHGRHVKSQHKLHLWGMYVQPSFRGRGVGTGLLNAAIEHARRSPGIAWVQLSAAAPAARRLYERAGFLVWGIEPDALRHAGESVEQHHMALRL